MKNLAPLPAAFAATAFLSFCAAADILAQLATSTIVAYLGRSVSMAALLAAYERAKS